MEIKDETKWESVRSKRVTRKIEIRETRDKRMRWKWSPLSAMQLGAFRGMKRTLHAVVKMGNDSMASSMGFKVTSWSTVLSTPVCITGAPFSRFVRDRSCGCGCVYNLYLSFSLVLSCRASRCRKRVLLAALPKKRYKIDASWAWLEGRRRKKRARGNRTWRTLEERNGNGCGEVNG